MLYSRLIGALWIVFVAYWGVAAIGAKRNVGARVWWREGGLRLIIIALIILALRVPALRYALRDVQRSIPHAGVFAGVIGVSLCALGLGLAVWARVHIGRNWGLPMSRKEDPELVTTGPYAFVRHPIYGGILLGILGSVVGESVIWLLPLILFAVYFIYSARREERLMLAQFPQAYSAYMKRTTMLLPFML